MDAEIFTGLMPYRKSWPHNFLWASVCTFALVFFASTLRAQNPIQIENAKAGTTDWQITNLAYNHEIEGYASLTSVNRGQSINFYVSTTDPNYTIDIFRLGWYAGLGGRRMLPTITRQGSLQTTPTPDPVTGMVECDWAVSYTLTVPNTDPTEWISGVYVALLTGSTSGKQSYIVFVVRDDARFSDYFFQCAVDTYEAYNNWGGKSLYDFNSDNSEGFLAASKVSFNRPYGAGNVGGYGKDGAGDFVQGWEYDAVRFLEREGYDVTYGTDVDVHENASLLLNHKADLIVGHSEYWSRQMRTNVVAARDAGVSLGFFAANVCYWQIRFEPSVAHPTTEPDRTIVGYKDNAEGSTPPGPDPYYSACTGTGMPKDTSKCPLVTIRWRDLSTIPPNTPEPENAFIGVMYQTDPVDGDILITNASDPLFNTTGLQNGDTLPGLLGYEVDGIFNNGFTPAGTVTLAASPYTVVGSNPPVNGVSDMTVYTAASGATVFATGSIQFSWGLDDYSPRAYGPVSFAAQQLTRNVLAAFISDQPPVADPGGPYTGTATLSVQFDGTGSTDPDGTVTAYEWDFGDGSYGTGSSPTHAYSTAGTYTITLIVTDSEGSRNAATTTATIQGLPTVSLSPTSLSFGNQLVGTSSAVKTVTLSNTGTATLDISNISVSGDFGQTNNCGSSVAGGSNCTISVTFTPVQTGTRTGTLSIADNAAGSPQQVSLNGTGIESAVGLSPGSLSFGSQLVGTTSAIKAVTLSNTGTAALNISSIAINGDFSQTNNCPSSLGTGANCTISVTFKPTVTGTRNGALTFTDDAPDSPQTIGLSGTGVAPAVSLSPSALSFGSQLVGTTSAAKTVTLTNTGTAALSITSITASGDFAQSNTCGSSVAAGANCTISVTFAPSATGSRSGTLSINDSASDSPQHVSLSGTGIAPAVSLSPGSVSFGNQLVGTSSGAQQVKLTNTGTATLSVSSIAISGTNPGDFSQTNNCGSSVLVETSCTISVTFAPGATGTRAGTLSISDNASGSPQQVSLSGTGIESEVSLSPGSVSFGNQLVGTTSTPAPTVTLTNTGTATLTISNITIVGTNAGDFGQTNNCGSSVNAGLSCTISVTFTPSATGTRSGAISITDNATGSPHTLGLTGTGIAPAVGLSPGSLSLGNQLVGSSSGALQVTLANTGTATLNISSITIAGTNAGDFAQTNNCPGSLGAGSNCTINVTFTPTATGTRSGSLSISDDAPGSPQTAVLSGTGVTPIVSLSVSTLNFSDQLVGTGSTAQQVTLTNSGTATLTISGIAITGTNATDFAQTNDCGTSVAAGSSCIINLTFSPQAAGTSTGTLAVTDNAAGSPQQVALTGSGITSGLSLSPGSLSFGNQLVGTSSSALPMTLTNTGSATLSISGITIIGTNYTEFTKTDNCGSSVTAGASCTINVTFTPAAAGTRIGALTITDSAAGSPHTVGLSGIGTTPSASLSPGSLSFGNQLIGTTSAAQQLMLSNSGTATLTISSIAAGGDFAQTNSCGSSVAAGTSCTIHVTFTPTVTGTRTGTLTIMDNAAGSPQVAALSGTGMAPSVSLSPGSLSFGNQMIGTSSAAQPLTLLNNGGSALSIASIAIAGTNAGDYAQTNDCGSSLAAGASCTISVTFMPTAVGARTGTLTIADNAPSSPQTALLAGTGVAPAVTLSTTSLLFGNQAVGTTSAAMVATLTNSGSATLSVTSITVTGTNAGDFVQSNDCGSSVAAGASCTISVIFKPSATGARTGTLAITDNAAGSPQTMGLDGTGTTPAVSLSPGSLSFGSQIVGTSSAAQSVVLANTGGAALSITSIGVTGANAADFAPSNNCGSSVAAGASCTINVTFTPTATGTRTGALTVTDNAGGSPHTVALSGTATDNFSIAPATGATTSATVTAGGTVTFTLAVVPNGLSGNVSFTCSVQPAGPACSVSPNQLTLDGTNPANIAVSVVTIARSAAPPSFVLPRLGRQPQQPAPFEWLWILALGMVAMVLAQTGRRAPRLRPARARFALAAVVLLAALWTGCGGGGGTTPSPTQPSAGTPAGTYTITVTGTSGNLSQTMTMTMTVN